MSRLTRHPWIFSLLLIITPCMPALKDLRAASNPTESGDFRHEPLADH